MEDRKPQVTIASSNGHDRSSEAEQEKEQLIAELARSRKAMIEALRGVDDYAVVYQENEWRVKDVVGHLAAWEREALAAIQAYSEQDSYTLGEGYVLEEYNQQAYQRRKGFDPAQCRMDWGMVRRELQFAVQAIDPSLFFEEMLYPWGKRGTLSALVRHMIQHEEAHVRDIVAALQLDTSGR